MAYVLMLVYIQRKHDEQVLVKDQLVSEISELQQEAQLIREIPQRLRECAATCKDIYVDVLSTTQVTTVYHIGLSQPLFGTVQFNNIMMIWADVYLR